MTTTRDADACSLREQKRRATLAAIEDAATALVAERGFDAVTVDDICARAVVSKRTFFNYVGSKEAAVIGSAPTELPESARRRFGEQAPDGVLVATLGLLLEAHRVARTGDARHAVTVLRRRREIFRDDPGLGHARISTFTPFHLVATSWLAEYLEAHPELRRLPDLPAEAEAKAIASLVVSSINLGLITWMARPEGTYEVLEAECVTALGRLSELLAADPP